VVKWALPLLGWTEEFDDAVNFKVAFRNNPVTGSGGYIQFTDNTPISSSQQYAVMHGFSAMTAIDTGDHQTPNLAFTTDNLNNTIQKAYQSGNADPVEYEFIGTDRGFYLLTAASEMYGSGEYKTWALHWAGDFEGGDPGDFAFSLFGWYGDDNSDSRNRLEVDTDIPSSPPPDSVPYFILDKAGVTPAGRLILLGLSLALAQATVSTWYPGDISAPLYNPLTGKIDYIKPSLWEIEPDAGLRVSQGHIFRGYLPGLYLPAAGNMQTNGFDFRTIGGGNGDGRELQVAFPFPDAARDAYLYMGSGTATGTSFLWWFLIDHLGTWYA
jgi:hypothetical protein